MSIIRLKNLTGASDNQFNINMQGDAYLNVQGGFAQDINSALKLPVGTTDERPTNPNAGDIRFNSTLGTVEGYNGTEWSNLMVPAQTVEEDSTTATVPEKGLVMWHDCNNPESMLEPNDQDANYWYNLRQNNFHWAIPTDRISTTNINGNIVKYLDFSTEGAGAAKLASAGSYLDSPWYPHCSVVCFLMWRTTDTNWRTLLRSRSGDHHVIIQSGNKNLGMYDNNGQGFQDTGYDINSFDDWDTKFNMYTWRFSSYESGVYSPNYQCFFKDEANARGTVNNSNSRMNRGFHHLGAWGNSSRDPHSSSQPSGNIAVFMYYNRHITQVDRNQIYNYYKDTFDI